LNIFLINQIMPVIKRGGGNQKTPKRGGSKPASSYLPKLISTRDLIELTGYSSADISMFAKSGLIKPAGKDRSALWPVPESVLAIVRHLRDSALRRSGSASGAVAAMRAAEIQLKMDIRSGVLIPQERAEAVCAQWAGKMRAALGSVAARSTRDVLLRRRIEDEISDALRRVCESGFEDDAELHDSESGIENGASASDDCLDLAALEADEAG
jgi:hypothetical protein